MSDDNAAASGALERRSRSAACAAGGPACADLRCGCGSLLARRVPDGVELKCRRCKRTVVLPLSES